MKLNELRNTLTAGANLMSTLKDIIEINQQQKSPVNIVNQPIPGIKEVFDTLAATIENSLMPLMRNMDKKLDIDLRIHEKLSDLAEQIRGLKVDE